MKITTYGGQTIYLPAGQVLVESEALDKLKAMAQQLQDERDELLAALVNIADPCVIRSGDGFRMIAKQAISKCTSKPEVLA